MSEFAVDKMRPVAREQRYHWEAKLIMPIAFFTASAAASLHLPSASLSQVLNVLMHVTSASG